MAFRPDIFVVAPNSPTRILLIVEAKYSGEVSSAIESQLKHYMLSMSCPVGLLVTPTQVSIYRDTYTDRSEGSIEKIGPYPVPANWTVANSLGGGAFREIDFEQRVRAWLEQVGSSGTLKGFSREVNDVFSSYVIPALSSGLIRGSGPSISST